MLLQNRGHMKVRPERKFQRYDKASGSGCSSPAAICYWLIVSLMAWGLLVASAVALRGHFDMRVD